MSHPHGLTAREQGDLVRAASDHRGPWPSVSIWQGTADTTVHPANATELLKQWTDVHGLALNTAREDRVDGHLHRSWSDASGQVVVEEYLIGGMAHGIPLSTIDGEHLYGRTGPYMLEAGISSSYRIAQSWNLTGTRSNAADAPSEPNVLPMDVDDHPESDQETSSPRQTDHRGLPLLTVIEKALKSAGLIK
jgi:feruloyl esterase